MPTMEPEEGGDATFEAAARRRSSTPIDTFEFKYHMFADDRGDAWS